MHLRKTLLLGISVFCIPFFLYAQIGDTTIEATPALPGPHETVTLRLASYSTDLVRSEIFWYVNDVLESRGVGLQTFQFTTGASGKSLRIEVVIKPPAGGRIERTLTFRPAGLDILWKAYTYTPALYKGKALPSSKSLIHVLAMADFVTSSGNIMKPSQLIYSWEQDGVALGRGSGVGKNSIILQTLPVSGGKTSITASVSSLDGTLRAQKTVSVQTTDPYILFYENHPLEGVRYKTILPVNVSLTEEEITVRAEPFFFSTNDMQSNRLEYQWTANGIRVGQINQKELTLRKESGADGTSRIGLKIENIGRLLQLAQNAFNIHF